MATQLNLDHLHVADKGTLSNSKQSAGFVVDPMLTPTTMSSAPHPIPADINSIDNPEHFDPSTRHPNTHYHPEKKLSKKKKAKKLGVGSIYPSTHALHGNHGVDTFSAHEKVATERQQKREETLALREQHHDRDEEEEEEEEEEEDEHEEDDHQHEPHNGAEASIQSKQQDHHERTRGYEQQKGKGVSATHSKSTSVTDKSIHEQDKANEKNVSNKEKERIPSNKDDQTMGTEASQQEHSSSLFARASATASGLASKVMNAPVVNSIMNKVGLAGKNDTSADAEKSEGGDSGKPTTNEEVEAAGK